MAETETGTGTESAEAAGTESASETQPNEAVETTGNEFFAHVRTDPEFAEQQIRKRDAQITELGNRNKKFGVFDPYMKAGYTPDQILEYAQRQATLEQNPHAKQAVDAFLQTGQWPQPQAATNGGEQEEEYIDPDVKRLSDEVKELRHMLGESTQRLTLAETRGHSDAVQRNVNAFMATIPQSLPEVRQEMAEHILQQVSALETRANQGDAAAQQQLATFADPKLGVDTMEMLTGKLYRKHTKAIAMAEESSDAQQVAQTATPRPSQVGTTETPPARPSLKGKTTAQMVKEALDINSRKIAGRSAEELFRGGFA